MSNSKLKDLGSLRYFLGLEVARSTSGINLNQHKYTIDLLSETGYLNSKPASSPMLPNSKLSKTSGSLLFDITAYRQLIGKLLYLTHTRLDISFAVQQLSQFFDYPTDVHLQAAHPILRYLKGSPSQGLFFPTDNALKL